MCVCGGAVREGGGKEGGGRIAYAHENVQGLRKQKCEGQKGKDAGRKWGQEEGGGAGARKESANLSTHMEAREGRARQGRGQGSREGGTERGRTRTTTSLPMLRAATCLMRRGCILAGG